MQDVLSAALSSSKNTSVRTNRILFLRELQPDKVPDYRKAHDEVWPELVALYKRCGIVEVSCLLSGNRLAVFFETDPEVFPSKRTELENDPVEQKWQAWMKTFDLPGCTTSVFEEVYRQSDH